VIGIGIISLIFNRGLKYGIDFTGGTLLEISFEKEIPIEDLRTKLSSINLSKATIQRLQSEKGVKYLIKTPPIEGVGEKLGALFTPPPTIDREEFVGSTLSRGFKRRAFWVVVLGMVVILIYIWIRFTFRWGVCAIIAVIHDVLVTIGMLSLFGREITIPVIGALLAIIGYSINDSIVISDRVRENLRGLRKRMLPDVINASINQTLSRTVLTSLTTLVVLIVLLIFGGHIIFDFALTLFIGVIAGTYSSIFVLSALIVGWERVSPTIKIRR
jgi:preprotein translocase subunit SecF